MPPPMTDEQEIVDGLKADAFAGFRDSPRVWILEESIQGVFAVHRWYGTTWKNGPGVGPLGVYPTLRKAAARLLQLLGTGVIAPQSWPEQYEIGSVTADDA